MHMPLRVTPLMVILLACPSLALATAAGELVSTTAPRAGQAWELELESEPPQPSGAVLFGAREGARRGHVLGLAGPDGRFRVEVPAGLEGLALTVWAEAPGVPGRRRSNAVQVTVAEAGLGFFDPSVDRFAITGCSLGCSSGPFVSCGLVNVFENSDLTVDFSQPVELSSVLQNPSSFQILDVTTGVTPPGSFLLDPSDPSLLIWRPQLTFSPLGVPSFGLQSNGVYQIQVNGNVGGFGPFVLSITGAPNASRMLCTVTADQGIQDYVPGPPSVALTPVAGSTGVPLDARITMVFDDVMNLGTLVIPATLQAPFITVLDESGTPIAGTFGFAVDVNAKTTTVDFTPTGLLPAGETIQVGLPSQILDLVGNPLSNAGVYLFTTTGP